MTATSDTVTARLEGYARARGLQIGVVRSRDNSAGLFFVTTRNNEILRTWISLGWNRADAEAGIDRLAADVAPALSSTGYTYHA